MVTTSFAGETVLQSAVPWAGIGGAMQAELARPEIKTVAVHKPGSVVEAANGRKYIVGNDGAWRRHSDNPRKR